MFSNANGNNNYQYNAINNEIDKTIVNEESFDKLIFLAESYMETNPEFAFNCAHKAYVIANRAEDVRQSLKSNIVMGNIFENNGAYSFAISYYEKAIAEMHASNDYESICRMFVKIAYLYNDYEGNEKQSIESAKKAVNYSNKINNMLASIEANMALGDIYSQNGDYNSALVYLDKILEYEVNDENINLIAKALTNKAVICIKNKDYNNAMALVDSSLRLGSEKLNSELIIDNYGYKAEIYDSLRNYDDAEKYYKMAITDSYSMKQYEKCGEFMYHLGMLEKKRNNINLAIDILSILCDSTETFKMYDICYLSYYQLSKCYAEINDYEKAYSLFNRYDILGDSANMSKHDKKLENIYTGYNLSLNLEEMKINELKNINQRKSKIGKTVIVVTSIVLSIMLITLIVLYSRNRILYYKNQEIVYGQQLKIERMESDLMEIQLKKNEELLMSLALHTKLYNEYINPIRKELKDILDSSEGEYKNKIKNIYNSMQNNPLLLNNTETFNNQINNIYKDFLDRLSRKYPDMTKSEKRLCVMLYINMSSKEIAAISNITLRSVETMRYRLRKKFNLSRDEDMINFLKNI